MHRRQGGLRVSRLKNPTSGKQNRSVRDRPRHRNIMQCRHHGTAIRGEFTKDRRNAFDLVGILR